MALRKGQWSKEKAWEWYESQPWIRGFNGYPSICVNRIAFWQEYQHKEVFEQIRYEFDLAKKTGFNAVRTIIQFEVWQYEHDSFMRNLEEYFCLADEFGLKVMLVVGNDCLIPKSQMQPIVFGEQKVDWGYHSGIKRGPHASGHVEHGWHPVDEPETERLFYQMVDELAKTYAKDPRLHIWDVWNEPGNSRRGSLSMRAMETCFEIIRSYDPIQPLTADCWWFDGDGTPHNEIEKRAVELSDIITFHYYGSYPDMVMIIERLKEYQRPLINNEWLNRIEGNDVREIFPLFYLEKIGSYHWGLIQGYSQTYEPWGAYFERYLKENLDITKWQHDLFRFNGLPYDPKEIEIIKRFSRMADEKMKK